MNKLKLKKLERQIKHQLLSQIIEKKITTYQLQRVGISSDQIKRMGENGINITLQTICRITELTGYEMNFTKKQ